MGRSKKKSPQQLENEKKEMEQQEMIFLKEIENVLKATVEAMKKEQKPTSNTQKDC